jgi:hypothetical protein
MKGDYAFMRMDSTAAGPDLDLSLLIEQALDQDPDLPMCVHRLYEEVIAPVREGAREPLLDVTQRIADEVVSRGRARKEWVSALAIGVHCEDCMYWSIRSDRQRLQEFGPKYESPAILNRLASHLHCHGL